MHAPIGRVGGKRQLKKKIIGMFPNNYEDMIYIEPFVGAGHIFYGKKKSIKEVINDIDNSIIIIHNGLKKYSKELKGIYSLNKNEFYSLKNQEDKEEDKEEFLKEWKISKFSFGSNRRTYNNYKKVNTVILRDYTERLKDTDILCNDYKNLINDYDSENKLFYFDPPYKDSIKKAEYKHGFFNVLEFKSMIDNIKGKFILSLDYSDNIKDLFKNYKIIDIDTL